MDDHSFEEKEKVVENLKSFLTECQNEVMSMLEAVGWTPEHFIQQEDIVSCSFENSHRMPRKYIEKHEKKCELLFVGYRKEDLDDVMKYSKPFSEDSHSGSTVHIDKETLNKVLRDHHVQNHSIFFAQDKVPLTPDEFTMRLTPSERAAVYAYVVQKAMEWNKLTKQETDSFLSTDLQEIVKQKDMGDKDKPKSYLAYLAAQRDYKRRRQSYRAKNVHITKKSYTEIIREVIENQTEYLSLIRKEEEDIGDSSKEKDEKMHTNNEDREDCDNVYIKSQRKPDDEDGHKGREKVKKKKKHKKHKHHKNKNRSHSRSESRSRSRSESRSRHGSVSVT